MKIWNYLNKKRNIDDISVLESIPLYTILGIWAFICLFPIYWVLITSFKEAYVVNQGPFYIPFIDFQPSLHAWEFVFLQESLNTLKPFFNTVFIAFISAIVSLFIGSMGGYALVRIHYQPKIASIIFFLLLLIIGVFFVAKYGQNLKIVLVCGFSIFILFLLTLSRRFSSSLGNDDIGFWMISQRILPPVVVVIPIYIFFRNLVC